MLSKLEGKCNKIDIFKIALALDISYTSLFSSLETTGDQGYNY